MSLGASTIIDNREGNTLLAALARMGEGRREIAIDTAFFSLDALLLLADSLADYARVRILFEDDSSPKQRALLLQKLRMDSDNDLLRQREAIPLLTPLQQVERLFAEGRIEARCYTANKFYAKAYVFERPGIYPNRMAVLGSGNFTRPGLLNNVELNVELTPEQMFWMRSAGRSISTIPTTSISRRSTYGDSTGKVARSREAAICSPCSTSIKRTDTSRRSK